METWPQLEERLRLESWSEDDIDIKRALHELIHTLRDRLQAESKSKFPIEQSHVNAAISIVLRPGR